MTNRKLMAPLSLIAIAGLATLAAPAMAQEDKPSQRQAQRADRPTLAGPRVREQRVPGTESGFSADADSGARKTGQPVPAPVFRKAIGELMAEDAPLAIRLSSEQRERIATHVRAFEQKLRDTRGESDRPQRAAQERSTDRREPQTDRRQNQDRSRDARSPGDRPQRAAQERPTDRREPQTDRRRDRDQPQMDRPQSDRRGPDQRSTDRRQVDRPESDRQRPEPAEAGQEVRQRNDRSAARDEMARALAGVQNRVWSELSAAQQAHVSKAIEAWRAQAATERMGRTQERYRKEIGARFDEMETKRPQRQADGTTTSNKGPAELRQWFSRLPEATQQRMRKRLESMPAERREALVARAIEMSAEQRAELLRRLLQSEDHESPRQRPQ